MPGAVSDYRHLICYSFHRTAIIGLVESTENGGPVIMINRPKIECEIHDLLDEAHTLLLSTKVDVQKTATLIGKLRNCADEILDVKLTDIAAKMRKAADDLERRLLNEL